MNIKYVLSKFSIHFTYVLGLGYLFTSYFSVANYCTLFVLFYRMGLLVGYVFTYLLVNTRYVYHNTNFNNYAKFWVNFVLPISNI